MDGKNANKYRLWFLSGRNRETDPSRELIEELTEEESVLDKTDLKNLEVTLAGYDTQLAETSRAGQEGSSTLRFLEIFNATLSVETLAKLVESSKQEGSPIRFATEEEIRIGSTDDGIEIKPVSLSLLTAQKEIKEFV